MSYDLLNQINISEKSIEDILSNEQVLSDVTRLVDYLPLSQQEDFGFRLAFWIRAVLAMSLLLEGEAELPQQRAGLLVCLGRGHHGDVHAAHAVDAVDRKSVV